MAWLRRPALGCRAPATAKRLRRPAQVCRAPASAKRLRRPAQVCRAPATAKRLRRPAQGCRARLPWEIVCVSQQPQSGCGPSQRYPYYAIVGVSYYSRGSHRFLTFAKWAATALRLRRCTRDLSQGSRRWQPWAGGPNRVAVAATALRLLQRCCGCITNCAGFPGF
jgi:hypothetical protein